MMQKVINLKYYMIIQVIEMPTTVEIKGEFEDQIKRLMDAGFYSSVAEAVRDAIRHILKEFDQKELAVSLYRQEKVSLAKAAKIAGVSVGKMKEILIGRGINPSLGVENAAELRKDYMNLKEERT